MKNSRSINQFLRNNAPTYQNVWTSIVGTNNLTRDEAKTACVNFAKDKGCTVSELFDYYKNVTAEAAQDLAMTGYYDV